MSSAFEISGKPGVDDSDSFIFGHLALANGYHVAVPVLSGQACCFIVPDNSTPNPGEPVGNDRFVPATANYNTKGILTSSNGPCRCPDKSRIVYWRVVNGSEVLNLYALFFQMGLEHGLVLKPCVVACYGNSFYHYIFSVKV